MKNCFTTESISLGDWTISFFSPSYWTKIQREAQSSKFKTQERTVRQASIFEFVVGSIAGKISQKDFVKNCKFRMQNFSREDERQFSRINFVYVSSALSLSLSLSLSFSHCVALWLFQLSLTFDLLFCPRCRFLCKFRQQNRCAPKGEPLIWSRELHVRLG